MAENLGLKAFQAATRKAAEQSKDYKKLLAAILKEERVNLGLSAEPVAGTRVTRYAKAKAALMAEGKTEKQAEKWLADVGIKPGQPRKKKGG